MNLARAVVRAVEGEEAVVELEATGCGRCDEPGGCGGGKKADLFCRGPRVYRVGNRVGAQVGDSVKIRVAKGAVARAASRVYAMPMLSLFVGAFMGRALLDPTLGEFSAIAGAGIGLVTGWLLLRRGRSRRDSSLRPEIIAKS